MKDAHTRYYGQYFWLSLLAFAVPIFVAIRAFDKVSPTTKPTPNPDVSGVDHAVWDYLLKAYVENGKVDYGGMKRDYLFRIYLRQLGQAEPDKLATREQKLALSINAYNAFVINAVNNHRIRKSVNEYEYDGEGFFDVKEHIFASKTVSLDELESSIRTQYRDPRIHMALVCAAVSCPAIRTEAYTGDRLDRQLSDQADKFANDTRYVSFDAKTNTIQLSSILSWYRKDWDDFGGVRRWTAGFVTNPELRNRLLDPEIPVRYNTYDWTLNSLGSPGGYSPSKSHAGSGTIENE